MTDPLLRSFNDALLNSIACQIRIRFEIKFHQNARTVGADSFDAEGELIRYVSNGASGGDQTEHLVFTIRQGTVQWLLAVAVLKKVCREEFSRFGRNVFPPPSRLP